MSAPFAHAACLLDGLDPDRFDVDRRGKASPGLATRRDASKLPVPAWRLRVVPAKDGVSRSTPITTPSSYDKRNAYDASSIRTNSRGRVQAAGVPARRSVIVFAPVLPFLHRVKLNLTFNLGKVGGQLFDGPFPNPLPMIVMPDEATPDQVRFEELVFTRSDHQELESSERDLLFEETEAIAFELPWPATVAIRAASYRERVLVNPPSVHSALAVASEALRACESLIADRISEKRDWRVTFHSGRRKTPNNAIDLSLATAVAELLGKLP